MTQQTTQPMDEHSLFDPSPLDSAISIVPRSPASPQKRVSLGRQVLTKVGQVASRLASSGSLPQHMHSDADSSVQIDESLPAGMSHGDRTATSPQGLSSGELTGETIRC